MNIIVKLPVEISEETMQECAKRAAEEMVKNDPDIVSVVRCKDCKFRKNEGHCILRKMDGLIWLDVEMKGDEYCSRGER